MSNFDVYKDDILKLGRLAAQADPNGDWIKKATEIIQYVNGLEHADSQRDYMKQKYESRLDLPMGMK